MELSRAHRQEAGARIWASVVHALEAVAEDRGWRHHRKADLTAIALHLGRETRSRELFGNLYSRTRAASGLIDGYEYDLDTVEDARKDAERFIPILDRILRRGPRAFTPRNSSDQNRLSRLLDCEPPVGSTPEQAQAHYDRLFPIGRRDANGFSPNYGYRLPDKP